MATLHVEPVGDIEHPDLAPYTTLRRRRDLERQARFVAEGDKVVERLLESAYPVESLLLTKEALERIRPLLDRRGDAIRVFLADTKAQVERVVGFKDTSVKAVGRIPRPVTLDDILRGTPLPRRFVAMDGVANAENMGVIVRNAAAMGVQALVVGETSCSPFLTRAIRTSMGAIFRLPAVEDLPLVAALGRLRAAGVRCVAAHPAAVERAPSDVDWRGDTCLVLGGEGYGISPPVLQACDEAAAIQMSLGVDSLNVASAAAAFFYEAQRQRKG